VVRALVEVETATKNAPVPPPPDPPDATSNVTSNAVPGFSRTTGVILYLAVGFALIMLLGFTVVNVARRIQWWTTTPASNGSRGSRRQRNHASQGTISPRQAEVENLLERLANGDLAAVDRVLSESDGWTGEAQRTARANQLIVAALNQHDLQIRGAALQGTLALDGVSRDQAGLNRLELAVGDPNQRGWALWTLGALANRGVKPDHITKVIGAYLDDPDVRTRAGAVDGLAIVATDETVPMLLDRFRNDPSLVVEERAACGLAEAGMYTHEQRMGAAASMVGWLDDALLSGQQKLWTLQALRDISGQNMGTDAVAWQRWYASAH
jgi:HEAT repeats